MYEITALLCLVRNILLEVARFRTLRGALSKKGPPKKIKYNYLLLKLPSYEL